MNNEQQLFQAFVFLLPAKVMLLSYCGCCTLQLLILVERGKKIKTKAGRHS